MCQLKYTPHRNIFFSVIMIYCFLYSNYLRSPVSNDTEALKMVTLAMARPAKYNLSEMSPFALWLLQASERAGKSVARVSEIAGLDRSYLNRLMNSHKTEYRYYKRPSYEKTLAIGNAVGDVNGALKAASFDEEYQQRTGQASAPERATLYTARDPRVNDALAALITALDRDTDHLARIGPDVDTHALAAVPLSPLRAHAGPGGTVCEPAAEYETVADALPHQTRAIRVAGSCMEPHYRDGDIVFVREQADAENGQKVVALTAPDDSLACKVLRVNGERYLEPTNGEGRIERFKIVGVVIGVYRQE